MNSFYKSAPRLRKGIIEMIQKSDVLKNYNDNLEKYNLSLIDSVFPKIASIATFSPLVLSEYKHPPPFPLLSIIIETPESAELYFGKTELRKGGVNFKLQYNDETYSLPPDISKEHTEYWFRIIEDIIDINNGEIRLDSMLLARNLTLQRVDFAELESDPDLDDTQWDYLPTVLMEYTYEEA